MSGIGTMVLHYVYALPYPFLIPLAGALAGGEETIIAVCILAVTTGVVSFPVVIGWTFVGTTIKDSCVFLFGKRFITYLETKEKIRKQLHTIGTFITRVTHKNYFLTLLITKFLYGTRVVSILYMARERMAFLRFSSYNIPVTALWVVVTCSIGWLAGRGIANATEIFGDLSYAIAFLVFVAVAIYAIRIWLNKEIIEDLDQSH